MNNLIVNGMKNIDGMKFHDIEGGFGEGKKSILVKEIANIHERDLKVINQNISRNISRFKVGIDIVDLKGTEFEVILSDHGIYTQNAINRSSNIYLLSERGYSKLLKILEDDFAWEQYDKLVDGYFNMRNQLSSGQATKQLSAREKLELHYQFSEENAKRIDNIEERLDNQTLSTAQTKKIKKIANKIAVPLVGGKGSKAYKPMVRKVYKDIYKQLFRELGVNASDEIKVKDFNFALEVISNYKIATALKNEIDMLNNQSQLNI